MRAGEGVLDPRVPEPSPGPGDLVVRILMAGIATPDRAAARDPSHRRAILGHEGVGIVERAGAAGASPPVGTRVVIQPVIACAACDLCRGGLASHCRDRRVLGFAGVDGTLAERVCVPAANVVPIPAKVRDEDALAACAAGAAIHAAKLADARGLVTVIGDGVMGLLVAQALAPACPSVRLLGRHPERFTRCERWGIRHRHADEAGLRADQHVVVECSGSPAGFAAAASLVRPRGRIVLRAPRSFSIAPDAGGVDLLPVILGEIELVGAGFGSIADGLDAVARGLVDAASLATHVIDLDRAPESLALARDPARLRTLVRISKA